MGKIRKAATAVDKAAGKVSRLIDDWRRAGKVKGRIAVGLGGFRLKLTIEGEIDLPKQKG